MALIDRLKALKGAACLFTKNFKVPFDNNQAERDLRMIKAKTRVSGCFRTQKGAQEYLDIMSYASTAKKPGSNAYEAIKNAVAGTSDYIFAGCAEQLPLFLYIENTFTEPLVTCIHDMCLRSMLYLANSFREYIFRTDQGQHRISPSTGLSLALSSCGRTCRLQGIVFGKKVYTFLCVNRQGAVQGKASDRCYSGLYDRRGNSGTDADVSGRDRGGEQHGDDGTVPGRD